MNDDINVKVTEGLTEGTAVITNNENKNEKVATSTTQSSPFMPKMGRRNTPKSNKK